MTKKAMIEKMQMIEAASWLKFKELEVLFGKGHSVPNRQRSEWIAQCNMLEQLGVNTNHLLLINITDYITCILLIMKFKHFLKHTYGNVLLYYL
jgi:hypothetical protein